jgi:hypothetical protein
MENFDNLIRKKSLALVSPIVRAYSVAGNNRTFSNAERVFDDDIISVATIDAIGPTSDIFFEVFFDQPINNIIKFELIKSEILASEKESSVPSSYIQYLPTNASITSTTPLTDISEGDSLYDEYINIIDINGNSNIPFPYEPLPESPSLYERLLTTLPYKINAKSIRYRFTERTSGNFIYINEFRIFTIDGVYSFEFNDSVLETKAWNSSRYDGKQLQASQINLATRNDVGNNSRTPIIQKYTRNIYLGSRVVGMNSSSIDDGTLTHFEGFSYVTMHEYLTINDDLSITRHSIRGNDETNVKKKGFYRSFYHDFPINSEAEIKLFDETIDDNLKSSYNIFNNSGQLQKMLLVERYDTDNTGLGYGVRYSGSNQLFYATSSTQNDLGAEFTIYNQQLIIDKFFTGSLISTPPAWAGGSNPGGGPATP